ncbi:DUF5615 family PIN-like protein [Chloroflexota bacterium]
MRFLVDECTGPAVAQWLRGVHHDVFSVFEQGRGMDDDEVIRRAFAEDRILITNDKDFGEKVYRDRHPHRGIVLLRLENERAENKIAVMQRLLDNHAGRLSNQFVVVTETAIRFAQQ